MSRYDRYSLRSRELLLTIQELVTMDGRSEITLEDLNTGVLLSGIPELMRIARSNNTMLDRGMLERLYSNVRMPGGEGGENPSLAESSEGAGEGPQAEPSLRLSPEFREVLDEAERISEGLEVEVLHIVHAAWPRIGSSLEAYFDSAEPLKLPLPTGPSLERERLPALEAFGRELTVKGMPKRIFARDREIDGLISVLIKYWKPNPLLVGEPGVGKTALVEGLAERIVRGEVPEGLKDARIFEIRISNLAAGTTAHGALEERLRDLIDTVEANPQVIVFLDEIHQISSGYTNDPTADILKPALARGLFRCIGATTISDFHRFLAKEDALLRRFQSIPVDEPEGEALDLILGGLKGELEKHFGIDIPEPSLAEAKAMSERYLPQRFQPDKSLDVLDRACALAVMDGKKTLDHPAIERAALDSAGIRSRGLIDPGDSAALAAKLGEKILAQGEALERIAKGLARSRAKGRPRRRKRPAGILLFAGPPGTGKTECAEILGSILSGREEGSTRIDLSEFSEPHTIARLIGAPPGYIGYGDIPLLPHALERNPSGVLALDQFDRAHPQVQRLFQQIFESGRVSDSYGRPLDFSSMSIILTCTIEAGKGKTIGFGGSGEAVKDGEAIEAAKKLLGAELSGRLDEIIPFRPFDKAGLALVLEKRLLKELNEELAEDGIPLLSLDPLLEEDLAEEALKSGQGARALARSFSETLAMPYRAWAHVSKPASPVRAQKRDKAILFQADWKE